MNSGRFSLVWRQEFALQARRPLIWILILMLALTAWGLSKGQVSINSGNSSVGGTKAWITSEFNNAKLFSMTIFLFYSLFLAVAAGMTVMQDEERKVGEILHSTPLRPSEYIWGKFLAILAVFFGVLGLHIIFSIFCNHLLPNPKIIEIRGPLRLINYLRPALAFGIPPMVFVAGTSFAIGERTRKPILVFFLPVAAILFCAFFIWSWTPSWLSPGWNRLFMLFDPAGVRWLSETWLKVDRGVEFYNHAPVTIDRLFLLSRLGYLLLGLLAVFWGERHFAATLRGTRARAVPGGERAGEGMDLGTRPEITSDSPAPAPALLSSLFSSPVSPRGLLRGIAPVLRFEMKELASQPGLYLFGPIILLQTLGTCLTAYGAFDTPVLVTPGTIAVRAMNTLTLLLCFLTLFYTVESLRRERNTGLASIYYATPTGTASILFGKILANCFVGLVMILATLLGGAIAILAQGKVPLDPRPFFWVWGLLLVPTILFWTSLVMFLFALTNDRYVTYGLGLGILAGTGLLQVMDKMTWVGNWDLWGVIRWSDLGVFPLDRTALLLNRIGVLGGAVFFLALTVRIFPRRDRDAVRLAHRLAPGSLLRQALRLSPFALVPLVALIALWIQVDRGFQGKPAEKKQKDYWRQNLATWKDAPLPSLSHVDLDLTLDPSKRSFRTQGSYELVNDLDHSLAQIPFTGDQNWEQVRWTLNGDSCKAEDRSRLYVITPPKPLAPGDGLRIGFSFHGTVPNGITKNGGGAQEFILPAGVVLTSFSPSFSPVLGYDEEVGIDKDNKYEPRVYPDDFYLGRTRPFVGTDTPFTTRLKITAPAEYTVNSVGVKTSDTVEKGRRTVVWQSDSPVRFFNVVAGRWKEKKGEGTLVYYHRDHTYNVDEISGTLDAARRYYSEWFYPYPWRELKISEFPALAFYAMGFPTNIPFSEGIGFLSKNEEKVDVTFMVTAHESAHQWWANILTPGKGPGGNILSEGMAHFSTILLIDQVKGERARIEFCKRIEERYGDNRQVDSERPLVKIDGSKTGDETVTYDKGGWVFWMLLQKMGREPALSGLRHFITVYKDGPDYPVLQDFIATMRPFAPDSSAYDEFVQQWFRQVVVPEYRLSEAKRVPAQSGAADSGWVAGARIKNTGSGRMPVEVAAVSGERYTKDGKPSGKYRESRQTVILGAGEEAAVSIPCGFKPERILVDPDARVLQLRRKNAVAAF